MIGKVVTSGTFSLDGGTWEVDNNVWLVGSDSEVVVIDAAHDADAIVAGIGGREVRAIVCTHGHNDHINAAADLAARVGAPILLHPADQVLWEMVYGDMPYTPLRDGQVISAGGVELTALHTPGHAPGAVCLHAPEIGAVFTGDTLFKGGPGATGRSFSSFETIIDSIRGRLLTLPEGTAVHTGHGDSTAIGAEAPHLEEWLLRGH
ncbi:MBL fold metallo-hydrolase [Streptosporangium roseum]|uniref:Beta-lactamase domain-containing protein n=1 Tax=Streptosporangium roseum (strain ATCC 12428 / DSM 43021 / JCM 3005 / KCTC 9067 / NCIMB 10171 / NRRL 2505 / NI 9100) TaxID=479432 RepID=D2BD85_STRRD|nr:beta-lactamase domain-containing protein [Streptosporangium roseum DSM 43021]